MYSLLQMYFVCFPVLDASTGVVGPWGIFSNNKKCKKSTKSISGKYDKSYPDLSSRVPFKKSGMPVN